MIAKALRCVRDPSSIPRVAARLLNCRILPACERQISLAAGNLAQRPPTFIIGPPRCGSTLAIQVFTEALDVGFISNAHADWFGSPAAAELVLRWTRRRVPSTFQSDLGRTEGRHSPSECPAWWYRFFPRQPNYVGPGVVDDAMLAQFRRSVMALTAAWGRPLIFKNLYASLRIHPIFRSMPESLFVIIRRNEEDVARSLLAARMSEHGTEDRWLSIEPRNIDALRGLPPRLQVRGQVRSIYESIDEDLKGAQVPPQRVLEFEYESLCSNPRNCAESLRARLSELGVHVDLRPVDWLGWHKLLSR